MLVKFTFRLRMVNVIGERFHIASAHSREIRLNSSSLDALVGVQHIPSII